MHYIQGARRKKVMLRAHAAGVNKNTQKTKHTVNYISTLEHNSLYIGNTKK